NVEDLNAGIARQVLGPYLRHDKPNDLWWTRIGMGVGLAFAKRLAVVDKAAPLFETDLSDPKTGSQALAYINRSTNPYTDAELSQGAGAELRPAKDHFTGGSPLHPRRGSPRRGAGRGPP